MLSKTQLYGLTTAAAVAILFDAATATSPSKRSGSHVEVPIELGPGNKQEGYFLTVQLGTPPVDFYVQLDTGSSDLWVSAPDTAFCKAEDCSTYGVYDPSRSSTSINTNIPFYDAYGSGSPVTGTYYNDTLTIGGVEMPGFVFGVATSLEPNNNPIMGVGLDNLEGTALLLNYLHPGIVDALYNVGAIERRAFSVYLNDLEAGKGNILFGGIDQAKYTGDLVTLPIGPNATGQYDRYRVDLSDMYFTDDAGETTTLTEQGARDPVILDTGVTLIAPPGEVVSQFVSGLGAVESDGILLVDCGISGSNATLGFQFGGDDGPYYNIDLSTLIYLLPEIRYPNGDQVCYLGMEPPTKDEVLGIELGGYSLGDPFLRSVYLVYDIDNLEISLAQAKWGELGNSDIVDIPSGTVLSLASSTATGIPTNLPNVVPASLAASTAPATGEPTSVPTDVPTPSAPTFNVATGTVYVTAAATAYGSAAGTAAGTATGSGSSSSNIAPLPTPCGGWVLGALAVAGLAL